MKCVYCLTEIKRGTGLMFIYKIGNIVYYCSNTCFKNDVRLGRKRNRKLAGETAYPMKEVEVKAKA